MIYKFQSTLPARGATWRGNDSFLTTADFNPRSPHGERPARSGMYHAPQYFNPRSPHGERRIVMPQGRTRGDFNPRSPHGERRRNARRRAAGTHFNPRSPHGERLNGLNAAFNQCAFQSTLPARGATTACDPADGHGSRFQSTLPARGATRRLTVAFC